MEERRFVIIHRGTRTCLPSRAPNRTLAIGSSPTVSNSVPVVAWSHIAMARQVQGRKQSALGKSVLWIASLKLLISELHRGVGSLANVGNAHKSAHGGRQRRTGWHTHVFSASTARVFYRYPPSSRHQRSCCLPRARCTQQLGSTATDSMRWCQHGRCGDQYTTKCFHR